MSIIGPVVPKSIDYAKNHAKKLLRHYPSSKLSKSQQVVAMLMGHKDWHNLEQAIKLNVKSAPFDDELDETNWRERIRAQEKILVEEMSGMHYIDGFAPNRILQKRMNGDDLLERLDVIKMATEKYCHKLAELIIIERSPTRNSPYKKQKFAKILATEKPEYVARLPILLSLWWKEFIKEQPIVADALQNFELDPDDRISIINFSYYWGTLSVHYASSIPPALQIGVSFHLAERYADLCDHFEGESIEIAEEMNSAAISMDQVKERLAISRLINISDFYASYPREDFFVAYTSSPKAITSQGNKAKKILSKHEALL